MNDIRYALRQLVRRPGFTTVAVLTLAVAIGANVAIFSIVDRVLIRALPYPEPDRLVTIWDTYPSWRNREILRDFWDTIRLSYPEYQALRREATVYDGVAIFKSEGVALGGDRRPEMVQLGFATHTLPAVLGIQPTIGRWFDAAEDRPGAQRLAVLRHETWRSRFGGDSTIVGRTVHLDDSAYTVIGVMPPGFRFALAEAPESPDLWTALGRGADAYDEGHHGFEAIGRLRRGVGLAAAEEETARIVRGPRSSEAIGARLLPAKEQQVAAARPLLLLLQGAVGLVLLIACANVANLLLSRVTERHREMAVRLALGARRARIVRQLLVESLALGLTGGALGLVVAWWTGEALVAVMPAELGLEGAPIDYRIFGFAVGVSIVTALLFGSAPALDLTRRDLQQRLREGDHRTTASGRLQGAIVTAEVALAIVLVIGAGLLTRTMIGLSAVDPGFRTEQRLTFSLDLPPNRYPSDDATRAFYGDLLDRLRAIPGVADAATTSILPLSGSGATGSIWIESDGPQDRAGPEVDRRIVTPGYFEALGISLVRGRLFEPGDSPTAPRVMLVSRAAAERLWRGRDPIGDRVNRDDVWMTVVGIVEDVRDRGLGRDVESTIYLPHPQWPSRTQVLVLETTVPPSSLADEARRAVWALDGALPVTEMRALDDVVAASSAAERSRAWLVGGFGLLATLLAVVGIAGVTAHAVLRRTAEIGLRMALGAQGTEIVRFVVTNTARYAVVGIGIGVVGAMLVTRVLARYLYRVEPTDPMTFLLATLIMLVVVLAAAFVPARRAAGIPPLEALRYE